MKTRLKKNSILFIILIATLFSSCEKELFDEAIRQEKSIIKKIDFKSFKGDIKASQKLERLHEITPNNETNRVEYNSDYDVYYDVDNIILITKENLKYYTIPLIKAENDSLVKNLVLSEKSDGTYKAKISAYKLTEEEIEKIKNGLIVDLNNKGYTKDFIENESRFSEYLSFSQFNQTPCVVSVITDVYCFSGQHEFGDPDCEVSELPPRVIIRYVYGLCDEGGTAGGGGSGNGNNNNNTTSPSQNNTEGQDDAITTPVIPSLDLSPIRLFVNSLSPDQLNWWNLIATDQEKINIENYVNQNINVDGANEFALQFITQSYLYPNLTLDFEASKKSPANIDRSSIDNNSDEGKKFNFVFNKLLEISEFKELFTNIFGDNQTRNNAKLNILDHVYSSTNPTQEINGNTVWNGNNNSTINISKQILLGNNISMKLTNLEIAKVIVHECVHAYLMIKATNPGNIPLISGAENMNLEQLINAIYTSDTIQHDFMYNHFVPTIKNIVSQLLNSLTTQPRRDNCEELIIFPLNITNPSITNSWNWNDYFYHMSLNGLQESQGFLADFPIGSDKRELYNQYYNYAHTWLNYNVIE